MARRRWINQRQAKRAPSGSAEDTPLVQLRDWPAGEGFRISWSNIELLVVSDFFFPLAFLEQALDSKVQCFFAMKKMPQRQMSKFSLYINLLDLQFFVQCPSLSLGPLHCMPSNLNRIHDVLEAHTIATTYHHIQSLHAKLPSWRWAKGCINAKADCLAAVMTAMLETSLGE